MHAIKTAFHYKYICAYVRTYVCLHVVSVPFHYHVCMYPCSNLLPLLQMGALPGSCFWSGFTHLVVLYLHGNNLSQLSEVSSLQPCVQLQVLTLCDTPMSLHKAYRHTTVNT